MRQYRLWGGRGLAATLLVSALLVIGGCGSGHDATAPAPAASGSTVAEKTSPPATIRIPKIGAESSLVSVGLTRDGSMEIPSVEQPMQAAWYKESPIPGNTGPAIIVGHVDGNAKPGIFFRLKELKKGDEVLVDNRDGSQSRFVVTRTQQVDKDRFPEDDVYGNTAGPELRLITCGGAFDTSARSYRDNIIVYAKAA
ncbi:class F sortase [Longimycelium tulufanense]|uniref:Class F sortase n=1 Tax=Longimycelium tulufanense TaxID=907463 RepID=A0A8J3FXH6_9PSEU|nr:class F sortase [Longimycelium tulufanense]GGM68253.1 class F sortase [Longimycelium tulufanense]